MKKLLMIIIVITFSINSFAENTSVTIDEIPTSLDDFLSLRDEYATTPEGGAVIFILAMMLYVENEEIGLAAFTIALDRDQLSSGNAYSNFQPGRSWYYFFDQLVGREYLPNVYVDGTDYSNGYQLNDNPYSFTFTDSQIISENNVRVYVQTTSGNMPRPINLIRNNRGIWKVSEASSLFVGASRTPQLNIDDDL